MGSRRVHVTAVEKRLSLFAASLLAFGVLFAQGGCAVGTSAGKEGGAVTYPEASAPLSSVIAGVPFLPQEEDTCGPSSLAMVLRFLGKSVDTSEIVRETRTEGLKGTLITDLAGAAQRRGFAAEIADLDLPRLREGISAGLPVILLVDLEDAIHEASPDSPLSGAVAEMQADGRTLRIRIGPDPERSRAALDAFLAEGRAVGTPIYQAIEETSQQGDEFVISFRDTREPELKEVKPGHAVACYLYE